MKRHHVLFLFVLLCAGMLYGQHSRGPLNSYSYALIKDDNASPSDLIRQGAQAFEVRSESRLNSLVTACETYLKNHNTVFLLVVNNPKITNRKLEAISPKRAFKFTGLPWPTEKELVARNKNIVILRSNESIQTISSLASRYDGHSDFVLSTSADTTKLFQSLYRFWENNAHPVNFILCRASDFPGLQPAILRLSHTNRISGRFSMNGQPANGVRFNNSTNYLQNTQFCLPFDYYIKLTPTKDGYELSPQCISAYSSTEYFFSNINIYPVPLNAKIMCKLVAGEKDSFPYVETGSVRNNGMTTIKQDKEQLFHFDGKSYLTFMPSQPADSLLNMTFAIRFRLNSSADRYQTIVSQGSTFIIKSHDNQLCFTLPVRKDYKFPKIQIKENSWYNLCLTISEGRQLKVYLNDKLADTCTILKTGTSSEYFMIGNNVYQEHLTGDIKSIRIWNRALSQADIRQIWKDKQKAFNPWIAGIAAFCLVILIGVLFVWKKRKSRRPETTQPAPYITGSIAEIPEETIRQNSLLFFGNFSLFDAGGNNLTNEMFPKVKQLFLLITLYSIDGKGITTKELTDLMWPGMNESAAKNNRGVTIQKLRQVLSGIPQLSIDFNDKNWKIGGLDNLYVDFKQYKELLPQITAQPNDIRLLNKFLDLISGTLLKDMQAEWLDNYKSRINETNLDLLLQTASSSPLRENADVLLKISTAIFAIDEVNEEALRLRIAAYRLKNNEAMVRSSMDNFKRKYFAFYQEPYPAENL